MNRLSLTALASLVLVACTPRSGAPPQTAAEQEKSSTNLATDRGETCAELVKAQSQTSTPTYYVLYNATTSSFSYPLGANPMNGQEIVLCIDDDVLTRRYRLLFGARSEKSGAEFTTGTTVVGFAPTTTTTALRSAIARFENDLSCNSIVAAPTQAGDPPKLPEGQPGPPPKPTTGQPARPGGTQAAGAAEAPPLKVDVPPDLHKSCLRLRDQVERLTQVTAALSVYRDRLAQLLIDAMMVPNASSIEVLRAVPDLLCVDLETSENNRLAPGALPKFPRSTKQAKGTPVVQNKAQQAQEYLSTVFDETTYDTFSNGKFENPCTSSNETLKKQVVTIERLANHLLSPYLVRIDGEIHSLSNKDEKANVSVGPFTAIPEPPAIAELRKERARVADILQSVIQGYTSLSSLASRIVEDTLHRTRTFRLGKFEANQIVVASLEQYSSTVNYDKDGGAMVYGTPLTTHAFSITVREASWYHLQLGFLGSLGTNPTYELQPAPASADGAPTGSTIARESDNRFFGPAAFVAFQWCAQDMSASVYDRRCASNTKHWRRYVPTLQVGLPIAKELVEGNLFVGIGIPWVPYVSLVGGVHILNASKLRDGFEEGQVVTQTLEDIQTRDLKIAPFFALNLTSEVFYALTPTLKPAQ